MLPSKDSLGIEIAKKRLRRFRTEGGAKKTPNLALLKSLCGKRQLMREKKNRGTFWNVFCAIVVLAF